MRTTFPTGCRVRASDDTCYCGEKIKEWLKAYGCSAASITGSVTARHTGEEQHNESTHGLNKHGAQWAQVSGCCCCNFSIERAINPAAAKAGKNRDL